MNKLFWRVGTLDKYSGLWYTPLGEFTGLIHTDEFKSLKCHTLEMPFDPELVGYISAAQSYDELLNWFSEEDIATLRSKGFHVLIYESAEYKWYEPFQHMVIKQTTSKLIDIR